MSNVETSQYVDFVVDAPNATIRINGKTLIVKDGKVSTKLPLGKYDYEVSAPMYQSLAGKVDVDDALMRLEEEIHLIPCFKEVTLTAAEGVEIWVDDEYKGTGSWTGSLEFSTYSVECRLAGYCLAEQNITISPEGQSEYTFSLPHTVTSKTVNEQSQVKEGVAVVPAVVPSEVDESEAKANTRVVKGVVINEWGSPLEGASIKTEDGYASTVTDKDGSFSLGVPVWSKTLVAKYRDKAGKKMKVEDEMVFQIRSEDKWFATALAGSDFVSMSLGLRLGYLGKWGGYAKFGIDFDARIDLCVGVVKRISLPFYMYLGGGWAQGCYLPAVECGAIFKIPRNFTFSAGVSFIDKSNHNKIVAEIGIGYAF